MEMRFFQFIPDASATQGGILTASGVQPLGGAKQLNAPASATQASLEFNNGTRNWISFGTAGIGAPTLTNRSVGTNIALRTTVGGSTLDYGFGVEVGYTWISSGSATANASGVKLYGAGGTTPHHTLRADGVTIQTGGTVRKARIALTTPVTIAAADDIVFVKLTTPAAVAVNWPASPATGQEYCVVDATGDANVNNITHTPAAGNFNGAATKVQNVAYSRLTGAYTGAEWIGS